MMLHRVAVAAALLAGPAAAAAPPYPLGLYVGNANGSDAVAMASFKAAFDAHVAAMGGARPHFYDVFTDNSGDPSTWVASANWAAWSGVQSGSAYVAPSSGMVPVVGIPLGWRAMGYATVDQFYLYTIAGRYDAVWSGIVDAWAGKGYKTVEFRIAYEMNGSYMAWAPSASSAPSAAADFVAAFRRVADIIHAEARAKGVVARIHWNPSAINWSKFNTADLYPGDAYVDVIAVDQYSPMWPLGYTDWSTGGKTEMTDRNAWAAIPANRAHYWRYPNATQYVQAPTIAASGWALPIAIDFAKAHNKPIAIDETGVGASGGGLGPADDPEFPRTLRILLDEARAKGVGVRCVSIWDAKVSDGDWDFRGGSKPQAAAAWRAGFGIP